MKYTITIRYKSCILDNAGRATAHALNSIGFKGVTSVRIGKIITLDCEPNQIELIAKQITNSVMEDYKIDLLQ